MSGTSWIHQDHDQGSKTRRETTSLHSRGESRLRQNQHETTQEIQTPGESNRNFSRRHHHILGVKMRRQCLRRDIVKIASVSCYCKSCFTPRNAADIGEGNSWFWTWSETNRVNLSGFDLILRYGLSRNRRDCIRWSRMIDSGQF
jgi:hypothetical protein